MLYVNQLWKSAPFCIIFETPLIRRLESEVSLKRKDLAKVISLLMFKVITRKDSFTFAYLGTVDALRTCPAKHQYPPMPLKLNWLYLFLPSPPPALYTLRCMQIVKTQSPIHNLSAYTFIPMRPQCAPPALPFSLSLFTYTLLLFLSLASHFVCRARSATKQTKQQREWSKSNSSRRRVESQSLWVA